MNEDMARLDAGDKIRIALVTAVAVTALLVFWVRAWPWVMDDAYISLRYVLNACQGHGLVFNLGQRVEGVTNIGWILVLLPFARLRGPVMAVKLLSAVLLGLTFFGMVMPKYNRLPAGVDLCPGVRRFGQKSGLLSQDLIGIPGELSQCDRRVCASSTPR